jgi:hypothetical protein
MWCETLQDDDVVLSALYVVSWACSKSKDVEGWAWDEWDEDRIVSAALSEGLF